MKKKTNRLLSLLLTLTMVIAMLSGFGITALADEEAEYIVTATGAQISGISFVKGVKYAVGADGAEYTFDGWYEEQAYQNEVTEEFVSGTTYYAKWLNAYGNTVITTPLDFTDTTTQAAYTGNFVNGIKFVNANQVSLINATIDIPQGVGAFAMKFTGSYVVPMGDENHITNRGYSDNTESYALFLNNSNSWQSILGTGSKLYVTALGANATAIKDGHLSLEGSDSYSNDIIIKSDNNGIDCNYFSLGNSTAHSSLTISAGPNGTAIKTSFIQSFKNVDVTIDSAKIGISSTSSMTIGAAGYKTGITIGDADAPNAIETGITMTNNNDGTVDVCDVALNIYTKNECIKSVGMQLDFRCNVTGRLTSAESACVYEVYKMGNGCIRFNSDTGKGDPEGEIGNRLVMTTGGPNAIFDDTGIVYVSKDSYISATAATEAISAKQLYIYQSGYSVKGGDTREAAAEIAITNNTDVTANANALDNKKFVEINYYTFDDRFGGTVTMDNFDTDYTSETNPYEESKGYAFDGWYSGVDGSGEALVGIAGFAKWTKGDNLVVTVPLDLTAASPVIPENSGITWNAETKTLTLDGAIIDCSGTTASGEQYGVKLPDGSTINVVSDSAIIAGNSTDASSVGVYAAKDITITGDGMLTAVGGQVTNGESSYGIYAKGALTVSGHIDASSANDDPNGKAYGILANGISFNDGSTTTAKGGTGKIANGINITNAKDILIEEGATVNAYGGTGSDEYYGVYTSGDATVNGTLNLYGGAKTGTDTKEAMLINNASKLLTIGETGKLTADSAIKTLNMNGFGAKNDTQSYTVTNVEDTDVLDGQTSVAPAAGKSMEITNQKYTVTVNGAEYKTTGYLDKTDAAFAAPTKEGYTFIGWYADEDCTRAWNFECDYTRKDISIYAGWVKDTETTDDPAGQVSGAGEARVDLYQGEKLIATTTANNSGNFSFNAVPAGIYNLVITKGDVTYTQLYEVAETTTPVSDTLPNHSTVVEPNDTGAVVGDLEDIAANAGETIKLVLKKEAANNGDTAQQAIKDEANGKSLEYFSIELTKKETDIGSSNSQVLTIIVPYDTSRKNITVYRYHGSDATAFIKENAKMVTPADGHYYVDTANGLIYIYASQFSTYAIGYEQEFSGGSSSNYAVELPANVKNGKIEVSPKNASAGQTVTITVTPDKGFTLETLTVLDKDGKEVEVKNLGNNKFSFKMPSGKVTVSVTFMEDNTMLNFFVDVKATDYFYDAVLWAAENGITKGTDDVHFSPNMGTTRAQVVTFLWRAAGCPEPKGDAGKFTDVVVGSYYEKAVAWAIEQGITKGTSETTFSPDAVCTRGQIVTFLARFAGVADTETESVFTDVSANEFFAAAVKWAKDNGVTDGTSATTFEPYATCNRAQVVTFLYRWMVK